MAVGFKGLSVRFSGKEHGVLSVETSPVYNRCFTVVSTIFFWPNCLKPISSEIYVINNRSLSFIIKYQVVRLGS